MKKYALPLYAVHVLPRLAALIVFAGVSGCVSVEPIHIFAHSSAEPPSLVGRTVTVLPPLTVDREAAPSVHAMKAAEEVFAGPISEIRFRGPAASLAWCSLHRDSVASIRNLVTEKLPTDIGTRGQSKTVFNGNGVSGVKRSATYRVDVRQTTGDLGLAPDRLDPQLLSGLQSDYVLLCVPFSQYLQDSSVTALYGIVPLFGDAYLRPLTPRGLFALYETRTGIKAWESLVGDLSGRLEPGSPKALHPRALPVLGAAYFLTGDLETPLGRLLDAKDSVD